MRWFPIRAHAFASCASSCTATEERAGSGILASLRSRDHLAVATRGEGEPRTHLVRPADHRGVARLVTE